MSDRHPKYNPDFEALRTAPTAGAGQHEMFECSDGTSIFLQNWLPEDGKISHVLMCMHGMNAHGYYYALLADKLVKKGIAVYSPDYRHHGLSEGEKGDMPDPMRLVQDMNELADEIRSRHPKAKLIAAGESMGGAVCINLLIKNRALADGMILFAPALFPHIEASPREVDAAPVFLSSILKNPTQPTISTKGGEERGMRNFDCIKYDRDDPHHLDKISAQYLLSVARLLARAFLLGPRSISVPALIFQGGTDNAVSPEATKIFYKLLASKNKTFKFYPDAYHCLQTDPDCTDMADIAREWILRI